jgi:glycosyltransferase involved in cell wall biosynthesis
MFIVRHVVYECLPGTFAGGVQKMVFELASAQRHAGAAAEIWTVDAGRAGVTEIHAGLPIRYFKPDVAWGYARSAGLVAALAGLPKGAIIHAHSTFHPLNHDVATEARRLDLGVFFHPHGALDPVLFSGWSLKSLKKRLYLRFIGIPDLNKAAGIFALTPLEEEQLLSLGIKSPIHVSPNGIKASAVADAQSAAAFRSAHRISPHDKVILFVGRIMAKKRLEDIISAFAKLRSASGGLTLAIAGNISQDPTYYRGLIEAATRLGCAEGIRWLGFLDERSKPAAFAAADCFVHASESEGMALAILEAMSAGLPTVVTRGCYMRQAAEAGAVLECPQGAIALTEAIKKVLEDSMFTANLRDRARAYVTKEHDWSRLAARILGIYAGKP